MNNELMDHIRKLNEEQRLIHEQRRQQALNKIKLLREKMKNDTIKYQAHIK